MTKYLIEGDIDFFKLLLEQDTNKNTDTNKKVCLITNEELVDKYVELECGHSFNYIPLWHEIYNQKFKSSHYKDPIMILNIKDSIRCPYCRNHQNTLLPFYADGNFKLTYGVTSSDEKYKMVCVDNKYVYTNTIHYYNGICNFIYDDENQSQCCNINVLLNEEINKSYCYKHFSLMKHKHIKEQKLKIKEEKKQQKLKEKEELKQLKLKEKPLKNKKDFKDNINNNENIIIGSNIIKKEIVLKLDKCQSILKTGPNKGNQCNSNIYKDNFCKRHTLQIK